MLLQDLGLGQRLEAVFRVPQVGKDFRQHDAQYWDAQHCRGGCDKGECNHGGAPKKLLARGPAIPEGKPVTDEACRNIEYDGGSLGIMRFVICKHRPHIRLAQAVKFAIPFPGVCAVGPSILEGKPMRFHRDLLFRIRLPRDM